MHHAMNLETPEPRWPSLVALACVGGLHAALPDGLSLGPPWLLLAIVGVLLLPNLAAMRVAGHRWSQPLGFATLGVVTAFACAALAGLLRLVLQELPDAQRHAGALVLLRSALALWATNILVFASWYWRLDAGGPHARHHRGAHREGAFLFPQMTVPDLPWRPRFLDYVFIAFNTSTAFSPTDVPVMSRWAKVLMMGQSAISLATLAVLVGRGINML